MASAGVARFRLGCYHHPDWGSGSPDTFNGGYRPMMQVTERVQSWPIELCFASQVYVSVVAIAMLFKQAWEWML